MDDDLDQLLCSLKLHRVREILDERLCVAEADGPSYSEFLRRLLREEHHAQQVRFLEYRIDRARLPERWALETYPLGLGISATTSIHVTEVAEVRNGTNRC